MCMLIEHYYTCDHPVLTTTPQPDHSPVQPETDRQECDKYIQGITCFWDHHKVYLANTICPTCEVVHHNEASKSGIHRSISKVYAKVSNLATPCLTMPASNRDSDYYSSSKPAPTQPTKKQKRFSVATLIQGKVRERKATGYWEQKDEEEEKSKDSKWLKQGLTDFLKLGKKVISRK